MALRDRQIQGIPLTEGGGLVLTFFGAVGVFVLAQFVWFPLFGIPEEFQTFLVSIAIALYISSCIEHVPAGHEKAQLFFGMYTGVSFRAGIHCLPRLPFPTLALMGKLLLPSKVSAYLGWCLEGLVSLESLTISETVTGMTKDDIEVTAKVSLLFEVENVAVFLSQTNGGERKEEMLARARLECLSHIRRSLISTCTVKELRQADYLDSNSRVNKVITQACSFISTFGLSLTKSSVENVIILDDKTSRVYSQVASKKVYADNTDEFASQFVKFQRTLPEGVDTETAYMLFLKSRGIEGDSFTMSSNKFKF